MVQSYQVGVSVTPDFPVIVVQQNVTQTRLLHRKLGGGYCFLWERGREDDTFTIYMDNKKDNLTLQIQIQGHSHIILAAF